MAKLAITLSLETSAAEEVLSALAEATERLPELRDALVHLLESGEQIFSLQMNSSAAVGPLANQLVMGLYPSDSLVGLVSTLRARDADLSLLEHALSSLSEANMAEGLAGVESNG